MLSAVGQTKGKRSGVETPPLGRTLFAWSPFIIMVALFLIVQIGPIKDAVILKWSIGLTIVMSILVILQAYVFKFMVP